MATGQCLNDLTSTTLGCDTHKHTHTHTTIFVINCRYLLEYSEPEFQSVGVHSVEVVLVEVPVPHEAQVLVQRQRHFVGHLSLQYHLCLCIIFIERWCGVTECVLSLLTSQHPSAAICWMVIFTRVDPVSDVLCVTEREREREGGREGV